MRVTQFTVFIVLLSIFESTLCERLYGQIYSSIEGGAACFRRLNGTHQTGCSSSYNGGVGIVLIVKDYTDAQWLVYNSTAGPYMAVVSTTLFHEVIELFMASPNNIAGVLLFDNATQRADSFTQEMQCPNMYSSAADSKCPSPTGSVWNQGGTALLRRDIPFPMFYLPQSRNEEIVKIEECHNRFNLDRKNHKGVPLCSVQMNSFMYAAVDTNVCMRRSAATTFFTSTKVCDPLGDHNVYYSLFPRAKETNATKKSVTLVTARIDSASLFDGVSPGAASSVIGLVSLITAAASLSKMIPIADADKYNHNILWTLFNGEAFDYIGSQRVAYDLKRGSWPHTALSPSDIKLHIDIGQIGGAVADNAGWPLRAYVPYDAGEIPAKITEFLVQAENYTNEFNTSLNFAAQFTKDIPPSSIHSFRNILSNVTRSGELPELVLVDHNETFTNKFYHSVLDDYEAVNFVYRNITIGDNGTFIDTDVLIKNGTMKESDMQVRIARLATVLSRTLYQQVTGSVYTGNSSASAHLVDELLYCFLQSQACSLLKSADYAASEHDAVTRPAPLYVGVGAWASPPAVFVGHLLALLAGAPLPGGRKQCDGNNDPNYSHYWLQGWDHNGVCIQTTMNFSQAISPAFIAQGYDLRSGTYSSWTESVWQSMWARVFVSAGGGGAAAAAAAGGGATLLAAAAVYWLRRRAAVIFCNAPVPSPPPHAAGILRTVNC